MRQGNRHVRIGSTAEVSRLLSLVIASQGYIENMEKVRLRDTWVLRKHELARLGIIYVAFSAAWFVVGWLLTHPLKDSFIVHNDERISQWFVDRRTPRWSHS